LTSVLLVCLVNLGVFSVFRIAFWATFHATAPNVPAADLAKAFYLGLKFDLRLAMLLTLPVLLLSWLPGFEPVRSRRGRRVWLGYFVGTASLCALIYLVDFAHYGWLNSRVNSTVIEHARPVSIAAQVVWETYPVLWAALGLLGFGVVYGWGIRGLVRSLPDPGGLLSRRAWAGIVVGLLAAFALGITGSLSGYPLRWSHAFFRPNPFTSALALNPVLYFVDTWPYDAPEKNFRVEAVREAYEDVAHYLGIEPTHREELSFARSVRPMAGVAHRPNVVIVLMESFGANKAGAFGNPLNPTPHFDAVARDSLFFTSFFVASVPTARSIFSILTGIPDVNPEDSSSRNPLLVSQSLILNAFEGYEKLYLYTGNLAWGNIRGLLTHNIPDLRMFQQWDYSSPRNDGWGISDLDLFREVNSVLRTIEDRPFFAFVQTSGNHPPNTIPKDRGDFQTVQIEDEELLRQNNFRSIEELNSLRFIDYSLGHFFELARQEEYFDHTLFLILGDHGSRGTGVNPWEALGLTSIHVPFVIYGPALIPEARAIDRPVSSLDIFPTVAGLAGIPYINTTLGRDMLGPQSEGEDYVFSRVALLDHEFYLPAGQNRLHQYRSETPTEDVGGQYPDRMRRMQLRWTQLHETARYLLHHNRRN
jgi:phosphoglycerol transferase MdoB-like AlkP superfamily enzyme